STELLVARSAMEERQARSLREAGDIGRSIDRLQRLAARLGDELASRRPTRDSSPRRGSKPAPASPFDELEMDRYSELQVLARDLAELSAELAGAASALRRPSGDLQQDVRRVGRLAT